MTTLCRSQLNIPFSDYNFGYCNIQLIRGYLIKDDVTVILILDVFSSDDISFSFIIKKNTNVRWLSIGVASVGVWQLRHTSSSAGKDTSTAQPARKLFRLKTERKLRTWKIAYASLLIILL
jgi:hypothetical protein